MLVLEKSSRHCKTLVGQLQFWANASAERTAFTFPTNDDRDDESLTYGELDRRARSLAAELQARGAAGERVLLVYPNSLDYIVGFYGCLYAGVIAVTVFPPRPNRTFDRVETIATDSGAKLALTSPETLNDLRSWHPDDPVLNNLDWLVTDELDSGLEERWREPDIDGNSLAFLQYTSGSTATPRGVMVTHDNLLHNNRMLSEVVEWSADDVCVSWLPLFHDFGLIGVVLTTVYNGTPCYLMKPESFITNPFRWLEAVSRFRGTVCGAPNFAWEMCTRRITPKQRESLDLSCWRAAFNAAEPVRHATLQQFAKTFEPCGFSMNSFYPCYGLAEATLFVTGGDEQSAPVIMDLDGDALDRGKVVTRTDETDRSRIYVGCGRPWSEQEIAIVDPETLRRCAKDEVGEIWVSGDSVAAGYWQNPEATEKTFRAFIAGTGEGPYLRTGDLGAICENELIIAGRIKDLLIIGGQNYYPQDIELTVQQCDPAFSAATVVAFAVEENGQERPVVVAELNRRLQPRNLDDASGSASLTSIMEAVRRAVADNHDLNAQRIVLVQQFSLPRTSSGKIQRSRCREQLVKKELRTVAEL